MSDLQISLLVIGAFVIAGVYLFNQWQERQFRRRIEQAFAREHDDVLLREDAVAGAAAGRQEPTLQPGPDSAPARRESEASSSMRIDPVIDYVVEVDLPAAAVGSDLRDELATLGAGWSKPVLMEGYDAADDEWRMGEAEAGCSRLRFALQLSSRGGCVTEAQLNAFRDAVTAWTAGRHGGAKCEDVASAHARAVELDQFCADVDIAIGINVVAADGAPFSGARILALAQQAGLSPGADGLLRAHDGRGGTHYTLGNHEAQPFALDRMDALATRGVTFLLDVPRVDGALAAFDAMLATAKGFATALGGVLVDDNRAPLADEAVAKIRRNLESILAKMEAGRIVAGESRALRLFS